MNLIFIFILSNFFALFSADDNILLKKPVTISGDRADSVKINDGNNKDSCISLGSENANWAVFDLQDVYYIQRMVLWSGNHRNKEPISFYVGDEFMPCIFHKQIKSYRKCQLNIIQSEEKMEFKCSGSGTVGQYIALIQGDFSNDKKQDELKFCELEAYGRFLPHRVPKKRPELANNPIPPISSYTFEIIQEIRKDVPKVTIPAYSTGIYFVNENCEPIIRDYSTLSDFSIACTTKDRKGRIAIFGKSNFFQHILKTNSMNTLKLNLLKWLSPRSSNPNVIQSETIKSKDDLKAQVKNGDIIDFSVWTPMPNDILQEIKSMLLDGFISITMCHTFWVETSIESRNSYMEILDIFNVDFSSKIINYKTERDLTFVNSDINEAFLGIEQNLQRVHENHDYFLKMMQTISIEMNKIPAALIKRSKVRMYVDRLIEKYNELIKWICPCKVNPSVDKTDRYIIESFTNLVQNQILTHSGYKLPCLDLFPGDFDKSPTKTDATITVKSHTADTLSPIGYYLEPGETLDYNVINVQGKWSMSIGCHTDKLDDRREAWARYPYIYIDKVPLQNKGSVYSPFGGVIWLHNSNAYQNITISMSNLISSPFFNIRDKSSIRKWQKRRNEPGLWAQIAGNNIIFCVESKNIKTINGNDLEHLIVDQWDWLVRSDHYLKSVDWKTKRPEIVVLDVMTKMGYGHSGYPIVVMNDWYNGIFNITEIKTIGSWGMCHEIGHNMQENSWTFEGTGEVTNNLLCLYNYDKIWKLPYYGSNELKLYRDHDRTPDVKKYLSNRADFAIWKDNPFTALLTYAQMANNFGWGFYQKVFSYYKNNKISPSSNDDKIQTWINVTSIISRQNLLPIYDFWGFPISDQTKKSLDNLPFYFPNDFYRTISDSRTTYIENKYKSHQTESEFFEDLFIDELKKESLADFIEDSNN